MASGDLISRIYSSFRGVDFRGEEINLVRSPDSLNVWRNYKKTEGIETRPGMELLSIVDENGNKIFGDGKTINGIYFYNDVMLVHYGNLLYKIVDGVAETFMVVEDRKSDAFIFNNLLYFKDGTDYLLYDGETWKSIEAVAHIPTTTIGRKAGAIGGGTVYENVNLVTAFRIKTFIGDGESTEVYLDAQNLDRIDSSLAEINNFLAGIMINNASVLDIYREEADGSLTRVYDIDFDRENGKVTITPAPPAPLTDGQDNVSIKFKKTIDKSKILNCTLLQVFDNRVFFSGNPDYPHMMWHSSLNDPTYCSDLDYYHEGLDFAKVNGMVAGNNALWVFKEPSQANTSIFYHVPTIDAEYGKIYPSVHSNISTGCVGKAINFNDDIVFFSDRGMEGINGDITTEQVISHRSSLVDRLMTAEPDYKDMLLEEWEGYLLVFMGKKVYLADSRAMFSNENHGEYEWFMWELAKEITCTRVHKGTLYLGTEGGLYTLTDFDGALTDGGDKPIESYWVTPKDKFKHPQYLKTTNKRGCTVEAVTVIKDGDEILEAGDITVSVKTEKSGFEAVGTFTNIVDYFVCRIKRKKFKDIQLKFSSKTRFILESASLECFIGGYIKR